MNSIVMRNFLALLLLCCGLSASAAEPKKACSGSAFLATNYSWFGIPVMRNASQSAGDQVRCLYLVPVSVALVEGWHRQRLAEEGWTALGREPIDRGVALEFRKADQVIRVVITDLELGTAVLLKAPVLITARRE